MRMNDCLKKKSIILANAAMSHSGFQGSFSVCFGLRKKRLAETGTKTQEDPGLLNLQF